MAALLTNAIKGVGIDAICNALDDGASAPLLEIQTSADAVLLAIGLHATDAVAAASGGSASFNAPTTGGGSWATFSQNPSAAGVAAKGIVKDGNGVAQLQLTVGTSGAELNFTSLTFATDIPVTMTTAPTITIS